MKKFLIGYIVALSMTLVMMSCSGRAVNADEDETTERQDDPEALFEGMLGTVKVVEPIAAQIENTSPGGRGRSADESRSSEPPYVETSSPRNTGAMKWQVDGNQKPLSMSRRCLPPLSRCLLSPVVMPSS